MRSARNRFCGVTKKLLCFVGQWPYQERRGRLFAMGVVIISVCSIQIPQISNSIRCDGDLQCLLITLPPFLLVLIATMKILTLQLNHSKIKDLTERLLGNWERLRSPEEYEIMRTYTANGSWFVLLYWICLNATAFMFVISSFVPRVLDAVAPLNESRPILLPYEGYFFVDKKEYFYYILLYCAAGGAVCMTAIVAYDCMLLTCVHHVCGVFAVAGRRFEHLVQKRVHVVEAVNGNLDDTYERKVALCVQAHWVALEFAELIEATFSMSFMVLIIIIIVSLSFSMVQITIRSDNVVEVIRYLTDVICQLLHLFIFSWQGQKVIDHSLRMRDRIYNCRWYKISARSQRLLLNVMRRSLRPNVLTAGRIYIFSLQSFTTVVRMSVSYFTVLESFQ